MHLFRAGVKSGDCVHDRDGAVDPFFDLLEFCFRYLIEPGQMFEIIQIFDEKKRPDRKNTPDADRNNCRDQSTQTTLAKNIL